MDYIDNTIMGEAVREHIHVRGKGRCTDKCGPAIAAAYRQLVAIYAEAFQRFVAHERARADLWRYL